MNAKGIWGPATEEDGSYGSDGSLDLLFMSYDLLFGLDGGEWGGVFGRGGGVGQERKV